MNEQRVVDTEVRERAVHEVRSFIVQAPAGSGKTELLAQRFLRLLATVNEPEEIVAITFTRKAASEMQQRILEALDMTVDEEPKESHRKLTYMLAREALRRDQEREWQLRDHPARLRVQTIDSFNAMLTRQMPVLAQFGSQPGISEFPESLYLEAAERCLLADSDGDDRFQRALHRLLLHVDNDFPRARNLLIGMLEKRDQWLEPLGGVRVNRSVLEAGLQREIEQKLQELQDCVPDALENELVALSRYAAEQTRQRDPESQLIPCADLDGLPGSRCDAVPQWRGIAAWLLTAQGKLRKNVNVRVGFPPRDDGEKARAQELLTQLAEHDGLVHKLDSVRALPEPCYTEEQWEILESLLTLLPRAVEQLRAVFGESGEVDYAELALRALAALGTDEVPSELALNLDHQISHLLVDEFQDTSTNQHRLLERLTLGWQPGDGRTLFVVGDPMQSIYRFREAEVGLFLRARHDGIGGVQLEPLKLSVNFRSQAGIVDWINDAFDSVLPGNENISDGAVPYSESVAHHPALAILPVQVHPAYDPDLQAEAEQVLQIVKAAEASDDNSSTAILVSSRSHLVEIVPRLRQAGLRLRAVEIEHLGNRPVVQDLFALTRAIFYENDRTAWLAILRAPWCGLELADLHALVADSPALSVSEIIADASRAKRVSGESQSRLAKLVKALMIAGERRHRDSVREVVESTWLRLAGPACLTRQSDLDDAEAYFSLLERHDKAADLPDKVALQDELEKLYAQADAAAPESLQVMTMHKAKGLEFDTVILPGLGRRTRGNEPQLLQWIERPRSHGNDLLLATISKTGAGRDPVYDFLSMLDREKHGHEQGRLLYVAATRARRQLHLLGHVDVKDSGDGPRLGKPAANTLLACLWPKLAEEFERNLASAPDSRLQREPVESQALRRLPHDYQYISELSDIRAGIRERDVAADTEPVEYFWAGDTARHVGTVVHAMLEKIANDNGSNWQVSRLETLRPAIVRSLNELGVPGSELESATERALAALANSLQQEAGRWLLFGDHSQAVTEFPLSGVIDDVLFNVTIDRSFVDAEGIRWIVDYKTGIHEGGNTAAFLASERERYRQQLQRYATLMRQYSDEPIRVGLYFPLLGEFTDWDPFEENRDG